jgi:LytR cell envelope-related transcriptional attenuator
VSHPSDLPSGRTRRTRRPLPAAIFFLVLAVAALGVWWGVVRQNANMQQAQAATCSTASAAPKSVDPASVALRVLNGSSVAGKAAEVATTLQSRGFPAPETGNHAAITGVGQIVYGVRGAEAARFLQLYLPGATMTKDTRADAKVDLVLGPDFKGLSAQDQVTSKLAEAASASAAC